jgi:hypothetical protein
MDYIHLNPVKEGFVSQPEDWLYSSVRDYAGRRGLLDLAVLWYPRARRSMDFKTRARCSR